MKNYPNPFAGAWNIDAEDLPMAEQATDCMGYPTTEFGLEHGIASTMETLWFMAAEYRKATNRGATDEVACLTGEIAEKKVYLSTLLDRLLALPAERAEQTAAVTRERKPSAHVVNIR